MNAYIYQAALWCEDCITKLKEGHSTWEPVKGLEPAVREMYLLQPDHPTMPDTWKVVDGVICQEVKHAPLTCPGDPNNDCTFDSDDYPKGPFDDGGGEADTAQHCDGCHLFLENPLTEEGVTHVIDSAIEEIKRGPAEYNRIMPAKGTGEESEDFKRWHGQPHKAIVLEWLHHIRDYNLDADQAARLAICIEILED